MSAKEYTAYKKTYGQTANDLLEDLFRTTTYQNSDPSEKAKLVGKKTFGKGLVQKVVPLPNQTGVNITIARYLTPNGTDINKLGIKPDVEIGNDFDFYLNNNKKDIQLETAKDILNAKN